MQSSAVMTLRALVMLLCLVLVPLAAIFGSSLPQIFNSLVQGRGIAPLVHKDDSANDARHRGGDAPVFTAATAQSAAPAVIVPGSPLDGTASLWAPGAATGASGSGAPPGAVPRAPGILPAMGQMPLSTAGAAPPVGAVVSAHQVRPGVDPFPQIEGRLRELGATYYFLETGGVTGRQYRFHCKVAVADSRDHTRHFDATGDDPIQTMRNVLAQVEQWRSGGQP